MSTIVTPSIDPLVILVTVSRAVGFATSIPVPLPNTSIIGGLIKPLPSVLESYPDPPAVISRPVIAPSKLGIFKVAPLPLVLVLNFIFLSLNNILKRIA